jgi:hypothetical protein
MKNQNIWFVDVCFGFSFKNTFWLNIVHVERPKFDI